MPELRKDSIVNRWVIIAPQRAERPHDLVETSAPSHGGECPFCAGNEHHTPHEILALRSPGAAPDGLGWHVRVVPNKYPAVTGDSTLCVDAASGQAMPGIGAHEVVIESPHHTISTTDLTRAALADVLGVYRDRLAALGQDPRFASGMVFKNVGAAAGASLEHAHSQIVALPLVPTDLAAELAAAQAFYREHQQCIFCRLLADELAHGGRIVWQTSEFVAFCPYAPRTPLETWIMPTAHASQYESLTTLQRDQLADVMQEVLARIETLLRRPAYNYYIHTAPFDTQAHPHYHWHIEIIPRVTRTAGFEWGTGCYINPVEPEAAARSMRQLVSVPQDTQEIRSR